MTGMILAAGLGTRLRPLTDKRPKALVEVGGLTLLEITIRRLASFGIRDVIVNVHHFADMVVEFLNQNHNFGSQVEISREEVLLDTGGGLKRAAWFFEDCKDAFVLHNVDVLSTINLGRMMHFHREHEALVTLAVQERETSRYLLFDKEGQLCGRRRGLHRSPEIVRSAAEPQGLAFSGIHVISPKFLKMMSEQGVFSIVDTYLRLAAANERIIAFRTDEYYWRDLGKPENVAQAAQDVARQILRL